MTVSVITSTRNRKSTLIETLTQFFHLNKYPKELVEYIVVDDGDDDLSDVLQLFKAENFKIIKNSGKGLAAGRNSGIFASQNDLIILLDDDIVITPDHVTKHVEAHQKFENSIVTAHREYPQNMLHLMRSSVFGRYKEKYDYLWESGVISKNIGENYCEMELLAGFSCSFLKKSITVDSKFNESFPYAGCEDQDFFRRMKINGSKLIYDKANLCYHNETFNIKLKNWLDRQYTGVQGYIILCEIYHELKENKLYYENCPVYKNDSLTLKIRKIAKATLGTVPITNLLFISVSLFEKLKLPDIVLFKLYDLLFVAHIRRGFGLAYKKIILPKNS